MNTITLIGYVGKDAESRTFDNGNKVASFTLATTERGYTLQNGDKMRDQTDWHTVVVRNKLVEVARDYVRKGTKMAVVGKVRYRDYELQGQKRWVTEIWASGFEMLGNPEKKQEPNQNAQSSPHQSTVGQTVYPNNVPEPTNDLPF